MTLSQCAHADTERGKDIPRRWGSYQSQVCKVCRWFRQLDHHGNVRGDWQPPEEYEAATAPQELD